MVGKLRGIDIRAIGSGNIGATNVFRHLGTPAGVFVLLADALKGWLAVAVLGPWMCGFFVPEASLATREWFRIIAGFLAILGHNYTCWLKFKGGKGIATSAGVLLALVPGALLVALGIWLAVFGLSRYVSLASISAAFALPFATWFTTHSPTLSAITTVMSALAIYKHRSNIQRLLNGTENRFGKKKTAGQPEDKIM